MGDLDRRTDDHRPQFALPRFTSPLADRGGGFHGVERWGLIRAFGRFTEDYLTDLHLPSWEALLNIEPVAQELAKVLLYLSLPDAKQNLVPERTNLERRLGQFGKLNAKRRERLALVYDRTLIGPRVVTDISVESATPHEESARAVRPHWRRGHFRRIPYGEGLTESRIGWIRPTLVKAAEAFGLNQSPPEDSG